MARKTVEKITCDFSGKVVESVQPVELSIGGVVIRLLNPEPGQDFDEIGPERNRALIAFYQNGCKPVRKSPKKKEPAPAPTPKKPGGEAGAK